MSASQPSTGLSLLEIPQPTAEALRTFAAFKGGEAAEAFGSLATFTGEETERENQGPQAFADFEVGLQKRLAEFGRGVLRNYERDTDGGPLRRNGGIRQTDVEDPHCLARSRSRVCCTARRAARRWRRSTRAWACSTIISRTRRPAAPSCSCATARRRTGTKSSKGWAAPSSSCLQRPLTRAGRRWKGKEKAMDTRSGNGAGGCGLLRRLARRSDGSASSRRGRGSVLGVHRDGQFP